MSVPDGEWAETYYAGLKGYTVKETGIGEDGFPFLIMRKGKPPNSSP